MIVTKEFIRQLNTVIETAIEHGGDAGGAYYCIENHTLSVWFLVRSFLS